MQVNSNFIRELVEFTLNLIPKLRMLTLGLDFKNSFISYLYADKIKHFATSSHINCQRERNKLWQLIPESVFNKIN